MVWFLCICIYMISWILHTFWLVLIYGLLEDRDKDDATSNKILLFNDIKQLCSVKWQITGDVKMYLEQQWYNCLGLICHSFVLTRFWGHLWSVTRHLYSCSIIVKYPYQSCCYLKQLMSCFFSHQNELSSKYSFTSKGIHDWLTYWLAGWLADWLTDWLADRLSDLLSDWLTDWLTDCLTCCPTDWLIGWLADRLTVWLADWLAGWLAGRLTGWLVDPLTDRLTDWLAGWLTDYWLTDGLTDWLVGLLTDWLMTDWFASWLAGRLTDWLTDWLTGWQTGWVTDWLIDWLAGWLADWLTDWLADWLTDWLADWLTDWSTEMITYWVIEKVIEWLIILCWMITYWTYMNMYLGVELIYCLSIRLFLSDRLNFIFHFWAGLGNWEGRSLTRKKYLHVLLFQFKEKCVLPYLLTYIHHRNIVSLGMMWKSVVET